VSIKTSKIYALVDPVSNQIRYIGQTIQELHLKFNQHWRDRNQGKEKNEHKSNWINKLYANHGLKPKIILIEDLGPIEKIRLKFQPLNKRSKIKAISLKNGEEIIFD
jgi:hypothetical protein